MNKKTLSKMLALTLAVTMVLAGCGESPAPAPEESKGSESTAAPAPSKKAGKEIKDLVLGFNSSRELETFNMIHSQKNADFESLTNCWDGLLETDPLGKLVPALAEEWGSDDNGLTWKFKIREGASWVDVKGNIMATCDANDFASGLEWILNYHKNETANTDMPVKNIKGAKEYLEYTKELPKEEAYKLTAAEGSKFKEMVGVEVPDNNTIIYHCISNTPYFQTLGAYVALYPISQGLVDKLGVDGVKAMDNESMWYNGAYTMPTYVQGNEKVFVPNPHYWDKDCTRFDSVRYVYVESNDVMFQLYDSGEVDYVPLTEANAKTISSNPNNKYHDYIIPDVLDKHAFNIHFNYDKKIKGTDEPDENWNKAAANEAFRKAIYYAVDFADYYKRENLLDPFSCQNIFYTMQGLVYTSDGRDYIELVREKTGLPEYSLEKSVRVDKEKGEAYKKQAIEELTAIGVTFPIEMDDYIKAGDQTARDSDIVLKNCIESALGTDFIKFNICEYVSSRSKEVTNPHYHGIIINGWGADYGDPLTYLEQETTNPNTAYYSKKYTYIPTVVENPKDYQADLVAKYQEYTRLVDEASKVVDDFDARYDAFAEAEAYYLEHALSIPLNYRKRLALGKIDNTTRITGMFGSQNAKVKNWKTNDAGYTTAEAAANAEARAAKIKK